MSGFENYPQELAGLDQEIHHYAAICGVNLANLGEVEGCLRVRHGGRADDKARETLQGLLILRIKVETEMIELGMTPPPLVPSPPST
jgi:hypothetical protein